MSRLRGAVAQMKQQVETLTLQMQFFHLDPKWKIFQEICDCVKLKSEQAHVYDYWRLGCLTTYADYWIEQHGELPLLSQEAQEKYMEEFDDLEEKLIKKISSYPNSTALDQIWYLYFATGEYKYLKSAFEVAGHSKAKPGLRDDAVVMYTTIDEQYRHNIADALEHDPHYFDNHDCFATRSAKYNWDKLKAEIEGKTTEMEDDDEIDKILSEVKEYKFVPDERTKKLDRGVDVFNQILTKLNAEDK